LRWAYIIDESEKTFISENNCHFLESEITEVNTKTKEQEIEGVDGVLVGANTFGSFELTLKFYYDGIDNSDLTLFTEKIKRIIHTRNAMYIVHSDMPRRKYAFNSATIEWEKITNSDVTFSIVFNCFKGYSESLKETDQFSLSSGDWQFEAGVLSDNKIKYKHSSTSFKIYNGSTDTINPLLRHKLKVLINLNAPKGFKIKNTTTGDVFEYKKSIKSNQRLTLDGVHPFINNKRVGIDTNWQWLTLDEGFNDIEIIGENISNVQTQWIFPFIYR
jgi:hypothetical protein